MLRTPLVGCSHARPSLAQRQRRTSAVLAASMTHSNVLLSWTEIVTRMGECHLGQLKRNWAKKRLVPTMGCLVRHRGQSIRGRQQVSPFPKTKQLANPQVKLEHLTECSPPPLLKEDAEPHHKALLVLEAQQAPVHHLLLGKQNNGPLVPLITYLVTDL